MYRNKEISFFVKAHILTNPMDETTVRTVRSTPAAGPQRHAIAHPKAEKDGKLWNMSSVMLGKSSPFLKCQYGYKIRNYFFGPDLRRLPSQQTPNIWYVLVANMLESNPVLRNISD